MDWGGEEQDGKELLRFISMCVCVKRNQKDYLIFHVENERDLFYLSQLPNTQNRYRGRRRRTLLFSIRSNATMI